MKGFEKMAKPRPAKEEEVKYAYEYAAEKNININNCEIRISGAGNIVCRDKTTSQDILMIPKAFIPMTIQLQAVSQAPKKTKAEKKIEKAEKRRQIEEQKRLERQHARELQAKLQKELAKNLKTATENINNNKKSTKCNQFIGNVDACNIINALGNSVSAEIHIRLEVIRKRSTIGKLADAIRKIDCKNVDAECSIEGLESKIISSVKRPVHDITLCHNGTLHIFDATCKYLKKQKDIKVDEDLLYPLTAEYKEIFMFVNRLCSRGHKKPEYAIGNFSNEKYNNGIITFTFKNCKFIYNISSDSVEFEPEQKDELLVRSERLNKQKRNIKICKKACEALKTEYGLCCRIKKGKLVIKGNRCLGALTISSENKIISADIKKWCKESRKNFEEEEKRKKEEKYDKIRILKSYNNLLCIDALRVIAKNERYITETAVVKNLRGMTQTLSSNVEDIENSGKYEILTNEEIQTAIRQLLKDNLIYERELKGTYGRFDILKLEEKASDIFSTPFKETDKSFSAFTDLDWVNYLKKIKENGKEPRLSKAKKEQQLTLLEHKSVIAVYPELVKEFLKTKPKEWQVYIETMYAMAAGIEKKYWKFLKDMVVEKKERKKKKETETKGTKIEQKTEKTETKTETKTEPAA